MQVKIAFKQVSESLQVMKEMIDKGANVNHATLKGETPLHYACLGKNTENNIMFLLKNGANMDMLTK